MEVPLWSIHRTGLFISLLCQGADWWDVLICSGILGCLSRGGILLIPQPPPSPHSTPWCTLSCWLRSLFLKPQNGVSSKSAMWLLCPASEVLGQLSVCLELTASQFCWMILSSSILGEGEIVVSFPHYVAHSKSLAFRPANSAAQSLRSLDNSF